MLFSLVLSVDARISQEEEKTILLHFDRNQIIAIHNSMVELWKSNLDMAVSAKYIDDKRIYSELAHISGEMVILLKVFLDINSIADFSSNKPKTEEIINYWFQKIQSRVSEGRTYYKDLKSLGVSKEIKNSLKKQNELFLHLEKTLAKNTYRTPLPSLQTPIQINQKGTR